MPHDPFYREIIAGLNGTLDPDIFEACAADLLRAIYPTLVPIRGGNDAGMDGAIADANGVPFPLVTTTSDDVIGNLTRNIKSYIENDGKRRSVVLATSQDLTPRKKRNLENRAHERGFVLTQTHDQASIAALLYRNPRWCRELLGLTGNPPALSLIPLTSRPMLSQTLIGREDDFDWLRSQTGDFLLMGQPGSGKTFLLRQLASEERGLFLVSDDREEIANAIRAQEPQIIMVDDADVHPDLLTSLRQIREELGATFDILAACWDGRKDFVTERLNIPDVRVHTLELLVQEQILQVINGCGLYGPNQLLHEIIDQAEGRPGLAVTLAMLSLQGDVRAIFTGDALSRSVRMFFEPLVGRQASDILAALSVGADWGLPLETVAIALQQTPLEIRTIVVELSAGGVLSETGGNRLSVRPPALRHALVRDTFFSGAASLPTGILQVLLEQVQSLDDSVLTIIGAAARGGTVPKEFIQQLVQHALSHKVWQWYAGLGRGEVEWILTNYPAMLTVVAHEALHHIPARAIRLLLASAVGDMRPLNSAPSHPLRLLDDWIKGGRPGTGEPLRRRRLLAFQVQQWLGNGGDIEVGLCALRSAMTPEIEFTETEPGNDDRFTVNSGCLQPDEIHELWVLWQQVRHKTIKIDALRWKPVRDMVEDWAYPGRMHFHLHPNFSDEIRAYAVQMLQDLLTLTNDMGVFRWASQLATNLKLEIELPLDRHFEILYPARDLTEHWQEHREKQKNDVLQLAIEWSTEAPDAVAQRIVAIERAALEADIHPFWYWTEYLCREISARVASSLIWVKTFVKANIQWGLLLPFLSNAVSKGEVGWEAVVDEILDTKDLKDAAVYIILTIPDPIDRQLAKALELLPGHFDLGSLCIWNMMPVPTLQRLLRHPDPQVTCAVAVGEWHVYENGEIPELLRLDWERVVLHDLADDYQLGEIFQANPDLAERWLLLKLDTSRFEHYRFEKAIQIAVNRLSATAQHNFVPILAAKAHDGTLYSFIDALVIHLVNSDPTLYTQVLDAEELRPFHLSPLSDRTIPDWIERAKLAFDHGYGTEDIFRALIFPHGVSMRWGNDSDWWAGWSGWFTQLTEDHDERIRMLGTLGVERASGERESALRHERLRQVRGWD